MDAHFAEAIELLMRCDFAQFEKFVKQHPELLEVRKNQRSLLTFAILNDRLRATHYLNKKGLYFTDGDENGETAIHWAIVADAEKLLKYILKISRGINNTPWVLVKDHHGITPIHLAARFGRTKLLKILLDAVTEPEQFYDEALDIHKQTPLHYAASCGRVDCCEMLVNSSVQLQVDQRDINEQTSLMCAAASTYPGAGNVVRLLGFRLLECGKTMALTARDKCGRTALHIAVLASNNEIVDILLNELECNPETFDNEGRTPLHYAAQRGRLEAVRKLLEAKARNVTRDKHGVAPAHYAALEGHRLILELLLRNKQIFQEVYDRDKRSCLMWAVIGSRADTVRYLLDNYAYDKNDRDKYGYTVVHHAAHVGSSQLIKLFFKEGWDINHGDNVNATPLHIAAGKGLTDVVRCLITLGANKESEDSHMRTPIFYACLGGQAHTLRVMITELDCKSKHTDRLGRTALHCSAFAGFVACIQVLLDESECPVYAEDYDQLTALHVACKWGKLDCVRLLLQYGAAINAHSATEDVTPLDCAKINGNKQIYDYLREKGGLTTSEVKDMAARMIQKWWKSRPRKIVVEFRAPSPPRATSIRRPRSGVIS